MKIVLEISKITISILILIFVLEACTRIFLFFLTTSDVFKYGFKKTVIFEVVDLSKFQILIIDKDKNEETKQIEIKTGNDKIWIFGGSTTRGYSCGEGQLTSWPDEVSKINKKFIFKNFAFSGANSDQQLNLMYINIEKNVPDIIMWANKFNTKKDLN